MKIKDFSIDYKFDKNKTYLSKEQISYIKYLIINNFIIDKEHKKIIEKFFRIQRYTLQSIINGKSHKDIEPTIDLFIDINFNKYLNSIIKNENIINNNQISYIRYLKENDLIDIDTRKNISEFFKINKKKFYDIVHYITHKNINPEKIDSIHEEFMKINQII